MDRFILLYHAGTPVAIQDRFSTYQYGNDELDTLCDLLNEGEATISAQFEEWNDQRKDLESQLDELERKLENTLNEHEDVIAALYDQIELLENQLADMQPQSAQA